LLSDPAGREGIAHNTNKEIGKAQRPVKTKDTSVSSIVIL